MSSMEFASDNQGYRTLLHNSFQVLFSKKTLVAIKIVETGTCEMLIFRIATFCIKRSILGKCCMSFSCLDVEFIVQLFLLNQSTSITEKYQSSLNF